MAEVELEREISLIEFAEKSIYDIQYIFTTKLGGGYPTLRRAMDIEDFLYKDSLQQTGNRRGGKCIEVWESDEAIEYYKSSLEGLKKLMEERDDKETDWVKLFNIKDVRSFKQQLSRAVHNTSKRKTPTPKSVGSFAIPNPSATGGNKLSSKSGKKKQKTKKEKRLEDEGRIRQFQENWEAEFNATDATSAKANTVIKKEDDAVVEEFPQMSQLMQEDNSAVENTIMQDDFYDEDLFLNQDEDSFLENAKLENVSLWENEARADLSQSNQAIPREGNTDWSTAVDERRSKKINDEVMKQELTAVEQERRRAHDDAAKALSARKDEQTKSEEDLQRARERERERRLREMQSQSALMGDDHEALGMFGLKD